MSNCVVVIDTDSHLVHRIRQTLHEYGLAVHTVDEHTDRDALRKYHPLAMVVVSCSLLQEPCTEWCLWIKGNEYTKHVPLVMLNDAGEHNNTKETSVCLGDYILPKSLFVPFMLVEILHFWGHINQPVNQPRKPHHAFFGSEQHEELLVPA
jgi:DNA-binding response OmpR family regulator